MGSWVGMRLKISAFDFKSSQDDRVCIQAAQSLKSTLKLKQLFIAFLPPCINHCARRMSHNPCPPKAYKNLREVGPEGAGNNHKLIIYVITSIIEIYQSILEPRGGYLPSLWGQRRLLGKRCPS